MNNNLVWALKNPYDSARDGDWATWAARGVLHDLLGRRGIKWELQNVDPDVRREIVLSLAEIIREAKK